MCSRERQSKYAYVCYTCTSLHVYDVLQVVDFKSPGEIQELIDLKLYKDGTDDNTILTLCRKALDYSIHTGIHQYSIDQVYVTFTINWSKSQFQHKTNNYASFAQYLAASIQHSSCRTINDNTRVCMYNIIGCMCTYIIIAFVYNIYLMNGIHGQALSINLDTPQNNFIQDLAGVLTPVQP